MAIPIRIPQLGVSMTEGTLAEWMVEDGAIINEGELLYVLETDKIETEIDAPATGVVRLIGEPGETYQVGVLIAEIS